MSLTLTTTFEDNFTRSNENPLSDGGEWSAATGPVNHPLQVSANTCRVTVTTAGALNYAYVSGTSFANDQFTQATTAAWSASTAVTLEVVARSSNPGGVKALNGYAFTISGKSGGAATTINILRWDNSGQIVLASASSLPTIGAHDTWALAIVGSNLYGLQNGNVVLMASDTEFTSGAPALAMGSVTSNANLTLSDFQSGNAFAPATSISLLSPIFGSSVATAFSNPGGLDLIQVVGQGRNVVWNLNNLGMSSVNPTSPTSQALLAQYEGASFTQAFSNPLGLDVFQIINEGGAVVLHVNSAGIASIP